MRREETPYVIGFQKTPSPGPGSLASGPMGLSTQKLIVAAFSKNPKKQNDQTTTRHKTRTRMTPKSTKITHAHTAQQ